MNNAPHMASKKSNLNGAAVMVCIAAVLGGCRTATTTPPTTRADQNVAAQMSVSYKRSITSWLGQPLTAPALPDEVRAERVRDLERAQTNYDADPHNEDAIIWVGRRLAYLGRYHDAIDIFSNGLAIYPDSHKLLRHRGHRYITVRDLDSAVRDLQRASELIAHLPDEMEPDGQPNAQNIPTSTTHTNIYYHLGLALYLQGNFAAAASAFDQCMSFSKNDDMRVATAYWQYLALRRANRSVEASEVLQTVSSGMNVIENISYLNLLLMFNGEMTEEQAMKPSGDDFSVDLATTGYGVGMNYLLRGEQGLAMNQFRSIIDTTNWAAFGHIAAEAELARANH